MRSPAHIRPVRSARQRSRWIAATAAFLLLGATLTGCGAKRTQIAAAAAESSNENADTAGVTDTEVKVGFIVVDQTRLNSTLGFTSPDSGDVEGQIETLAKYVNANGGIGGRNLVPVIRVYDALTDSVANEEKLCRAFTEDDQVFAVVLLGMFQETARPCYASQETLMLDQTLYPVDQLEASALAPYLYQPSLPEYGSLIAGLADAMAREKFLDDTTRLGVIGIDTEQNRRAVTDQLLPRLDAAGAEVLDTQWVDPTSSATLQAGQNQAVLSFKDRDIDRVVVVGGSRLLAFMLTITIPQEYFPAYAVTTFDNPEFVAIRNPEAMGGSLGISVLPGVDISSKELAFPFSPGEENCIDILGAGGHTFAARENARQATLYCDAVFLLANAFAGSDGDPITAERFMELAGRIGPTESASNYATSYDEGSYNGAAGYRPIEFDPACTCYRLVGPTQEFPK